MNRRSNKGEQVVPGGSVLEAAERFTVKWHKDESDLGRQDHASVVGGAQGNGRGGSQQTAVAMKLQFTKAGRRQPTG